jgi:hypothetical protein
MNDIERSATLVPAVGAQVERGVRPSGGSPKGKPPADALQHLREVVRQYKQMHFWRLRYQCEDPEPGAERKEALHRTALALAMAEAEKFLSADPGPNVLLNGAP